MGSWGKRNRMKLLKSSFVLLWIGFILAYIGGSKNYEYLIAASFGAFGLAGLLTLPAKK